MIKQVSTIEILNIKCIWSIGGGQFSNLELMLLV
jgi:hypothetical protein